MKILNELKKTKPPKVKMIHGRISDDLYEKLRPYLDKNNLSWNEVIQASLTALYEEIKNNR